MACRIEVPAISNRVAPVPKFRDEGLELWERFQPRFKFRDDGRELWERLPAAIQIRG